MRLRPLLLGTAILALGLVAGGTPSRAQGLHPGLRPLPPPPAGGPGESGHPLGELDCRACHQGDHQGVVRMYLGTGGRGAPAIPSHMFMLRVECIACHVLPEKPAQVGIVGQTFRPSEQACVGCHTTRYRGMVDRWSRTLAAMQDIVAPKVTAARAALGKADPRSRDAGRARKLVEEADWNLQFVRLGRGVHNVFYAADLLKLANTWLDESLDLLGATGPRIDDQLVRGGYCAVLCHEQAGVKQRDTVTLGGQKIPHVRHVSEFGATCTSCHSAETHKKVTATADTCTACHHGPRNERCESCHRAQSAFYRGTTPSSPVAMRPNLMAEAVTCTGCHEPGRKPVVARVAPRCRECHEPQYTAILPEWTTGFDADVKKTADLLHHAETTLNRARRAGRSTADAEALLRQAREALGIVRAAGGVHNPLAADALLRLARQKGQEAVTRAGGG